MVFRPSVNLNLNLPTLLQFYNVTHRSVRAQRGTQAMPCHPAAFVLIARSFTAPVLFQLGRTASAGRRLRRGLAVAQQLAPRLLNPPTVL